MNKLPTIALGLMIGWLVSIVLAMIIRWKVFVFMEYLCIAGAVIAFTISILYALMPSGKDKPK